MKKIFMFLILLYFSTSMTLSQTINNIGIKVGYVSSRQDYTFELMNNTIEWKSGLSVSAFVDLFDFNSFSISPELKYIQKGWKADFIITGPDSPDPITIEKRHIYHNYLSILSSLKYQINLAFAESFIKIAPRYDIRLKSYDDLGSPSTTYDEFKNVFGGTLSLGMIPRLQIGFTPFIELAYHLDFTNSYSISTNEIKNRAIEISLGVLFN